jgi:hypothetical protein
MHTERPTTNTTLLKSETTYIILLHYSMKQFSQIQNHFTR